jgi:hypothetical protein
MATFSKSQLLEALGRSFKRVEEVGYKTLSRGFDIERPPALDAFRPAVDVRGVQYSSPSHGRNRQLCNT